MAPARSHCRFRPLPCPQRTRRICKRGGTSEYVQGRGGAGLGAAAAGRQAEGPAAAAVAAGVAGRGAARPRPHFSTLFIAKRRLLRELLLAPPRRRQASRRRRLHRLQLAAGARRGRAGEARGTADAGGGRAGWGSGEQAGSAPARRRMRRLCRTHPGPPPSAPPVVPADGAEGEKVANKVQRRNCGLEHPHCSVGRRRWGAVGGRREATGRGRPVQAAGRRAPANRRCASLGAASEVRPQRQRPGRRRSGTSSGGGSSSGSGSGR